RSAWTCPSRPGPPPQSAGREISIRRTSSTCPALQATNCRWENNDFIVTRSARGQEPVRRSVLLEVEARREAVVRHRAFNQVGLDRKSTRLNSSHGSTSYAVSC